MKSKRARTDVLEMAYEEHGPEDGAPVILLHGFPYDARAFDEVAPPLAAEGCRALVPYLRGYGPTRFLSAATPRSGEPAAAEQEHRLWYQYYFHTERGRAGLAKNRRDICRLLWKLWSPKWRFNEAIFEKSAVSFDNPDFVDVVIQSYRHRYGHAAGDPALAGIEAELARQPKITVPAINLHGGHDGVGPVSDRDGRAHFFTGSYERRVLPGIGHNVPQEAPVATVAALRDLMKGTSQ